MCARCNELHREVAALRKANAVVRDMNIKLAVECNNLRAAMGATMRPIVLDHQTAWERDQEARA
jgi:hypothetical protein